jgi:spermidine synthase
VFLIFFLSGFCSLLYQIVWLRLAFASFGIVTAVVSVLISVFMAGLAIGSFAGGKWIDVLCKRSGIAAISFYALTELLIGAGALSVPLLFSESERLLFLAGEMSSFHYMALSSLLMVGSILPWCVLMGFTFPFMLSFLRGTSRRNAVNFSFLYMANVLGAMCGTVLTAFVFIEHFGFRSTSYIAACGNIFIAVASIYIGIRQAHTMPLPGRTAEEHAAGTCLSLPPSKTLPALLMLFISGMTSMGMEVVWVRGFTPVLGTQIYSFAYILTMYLLATWAGSAHYRRHIRCGMTYSYQITTGALSIAVFLPIVLTGPRMLLLLDLQQNSVLSGLISLLSIAPLCALLGYLTPQLIDSFSCGNPSGAGKAYAINIAGCIAGPFIGSYLLLPHLSIKTSLILLAVPYILLFFFLILMSKDRLRWHVMVGVVTCVLLILSLAIGDSYDEYYDDYAENGIVRRDYVATVMSYGHGLDKQLMVNGIGITRLTPITKFMAHLPLAFLDRPPTSALVICFGMGTTYRSLLTWGIDVTAVELVPSVVESFGFYFSDASKVLQNPRGRIINDDGRRYLNRTSKTYDTITIDPPPPMEAAGVSLLLSEEFYALTRKHLNDGGIVHQWFPRGEKKALYATARAIVNSFRWVKVYRSYEGWGYHFLASDIPLPRLSAEEMIAKMPSAAKADLLEWFAYKNINLVVNDVLMREVPVEQVLNDDRSLVITDDKPYNEYYMIRRLRERMRSDRDL